MLIQPVVLSGGSGTRLWPLSREKYPKQLLPLIGDDSMLQATVRRLENLAGAQVAPPMIVCNEEYRFVIAEQLRLMGRPGSVLLEPIGRNTAPALTLAALVAARGGAGHDPVLLVMPADHVITDVEAFQKVVRAGAELANSEHAVVTFGITPDAPETGYGYIQAGAAGGGKTIDAEHFEIARFVEKPDASTAQRYLDTGDYYWNSGLFMMRASVWLAAIENLPPRYPASVHTGGRARHDRRRIRARGPCSILGLPGRLDRLRGDGATCSRRTRKTRSWHAT